MAKLYRPKFNSWLTTLILVSIGLHGLVLALPMPSLVEPTPEIEAVPDEPEVIQVVTLPKTVTEPKSAEPPPPEPLPEPPPEEIAITDPEILEEIQEEPEEPEAEPDSQGGPNPDEDDPEDDEDNSDDEPEPTLDQRMANAENYSRFDGDRVGDDVVTNRLREITMQTSVLPSLLKSLQAELPAIVVPLQDCLPNPPGRSVSVMARVDAAGALEGTPELLNSTGYEVLDEKAMEIASQASYVQHHSLGESKTYSFRIEVDYRACDTALNLIDLTNTQTAS